MVKVPKYPEDFEDSSRVPLTDKQINNIIKGNFATNHESHGGCWTTRGDTLIATADDGSCFICKIVKEVIKS